MNNWKTDFNVTGAGTLQISKNAHSLCGNSVGFSIGVSWGAHGYSGGVLSRSEAIRLANHILKACEGINESEESEIKRRYTEMLNEPLK